MTTGEELPSLLTRRIRKEGRITFAAFMKEALYHPVFGRYSRPRPPIGPDGDYITSPEVDEAFGRLVGRAVAEMAAKIGRRPSSQGLFTIVEMGPGRGTLCRDLLRGVREEFPDLANRLRYALVESSEALRREQRSVIAEAGAGDRVVWRPWSQILAAKPITGCILANEFLDALPVHLVEWSGGRLHEVYITEGDDGAFEERLGEPSSEEVAGYFDELGMTLSEGQRAEVNLAALAWIGEAARLLGEGYIVIIDYGHEAAELFSERHFAGTLVGYRRHQLILDPLADPGGQDLTAHVDFTSIAREAERHGLLASPITTQRNLLVAMGLAQMIADLAIEDGAGDEAERLARRFALHALMSSAGMGATFKVLVLSRGAPLEGLASLSNPFRNG